ncbi:Txe/YoeB family addiction module toxin [Catenuloplanes sp. NPDC051500]|uniref:Txe/YoeB family addiction module toxin n=1 Tax=Catenuloplanes sp. NPDC051500 TaxID=3363959 RepID=UPI0037B70B18
MSKLIAWQHSAWADYVLWQTRDKRIARRINQLVEDVFRNGHEGIGKPEGLRGPLAGWWSRRIDEKHRLVYRILDDRIEIAACRDHYSDH